MEQLGCHINLLLDDPVFRKALLAEGERQRPSERPVNSNFRLRLRLAHGLRGLASRVEPSPSTWSVRQPHVML